MKKLFVTLLLLISVISCSEESETKITSTPLKSFEDIQLPPSSMKKTLEVGDYIFVNKEQTPTDTSSTSKTITKTITIDKIKYQIVLNSKGDTIYMATSDPRLITEEGYKVGTKWSEIDKKHQNLLKKEVDFGYTIQLDSKWQLGFCEGESCTTTPISDTSKVDWIFYKK